MTIERDAKRQSDGTKPNADSRPPAAEEKSLEPASIPKQPDPNSGKEEKKDGSGSAQTEAKSSELKLTPPVTQQAGKL